MAKWYGKIGYMQLKEGSPGVWEETIKEMDYFGDLTRNTRRYEPSGNLNDDLNISNILSILADPYISNNFHMIRYAEFMGTKWKVTSVEVQYPRLLLTLGGVYNEENS